MKLIEWKVNDKIEAYTTCKSDDDKLFNLSYHQYAIYEDVLNNRKKLAKALHTDLDHMVATFQQHTTNFIEVNKEDGGKGMYTRDDAYYGYDAMYTKDKDLWLWSFHADCTPILLYCEKQEIVAAIHSGWVGTINEITGKFVSHLIQNENVDPREIYAYIGPSINHENFEAKDDIIDLVKQMSFDTTPFYTYKDDGSYLLNSKGLSKQQLLNLGVLDEHITVSPLCTIENNDLFFSYRKEKTPDRNITFIKMK